MKFTAKLPLVSVLALLMIPVLFFTGCGKNEGVPDQSKITIDPVSVSLQNIVGDTIQNYNVIVRYADGTPIPYAKIHISGAFAMPASAAMYQFYYYPDGTQNPAGNATVDSGFDAQTDKFGVYTFSIVVFGPGSAFKDTLNITSGTTSGSSTLSLTVT
jgi:hypothetical protein